MVQTTVARLRYSLVQGSQGVFNLLIAHLPVVTNLINVNWSGTNTADML